MQRRAAAVYFALFVVLGAGAYTFMQVGMSQPAIELDAPTYGQGDELSAGGQSYTVSGIEASADEEGTLTRSGELTWFNETAEANETVGLEEGSNVTLGDTQYLAHFPDNSTVQIGPTDQYWDAYQEGVEAQSYYQERRNGFWGIVLLSFVGAVLLLAAAYLPTKG